MAGKLLSESVSCLPEKGKDRQRLKLGSFVHLTSRLRSLLMMTLSQGSKRQSLVSCYSRSGSPSLPEYRQKGVHNGQQEDSGCHTLGAFSRR